MQLISHGGSPASRPDHAVRILIHPLLKPGIAPQSRFRTVRDQYKIERTVPALVAIGQDDMSPIDFRGEHVMVGKNRHGLSLDGFLEHLEEIATMHAVGSAARFDAAIVKMNEFSPSMGKGV